MDPQTAKGMNDGFLPSEEQEHEHTDGEQRGIGRKNRSIGDGRAVDGIEFQIGEPFSDRIERIAELAVGSAPGRGRIAIAHMPVGAIIPIVTELLVASGGVVIHDGIPAACCLAV